MTSESDSNLAIHFTSKTEITDAIRLYTQKRFERLKHYVHLILEVQVTFDIIKQTHEARAEIRLRNRRVINAKVESNDLYTSIDKLVDKLLGQLRKSHDKQVKRN